MFIQQSPAARFRKISRAILPILTISIITIAYSASDTAFSSVGESAESTQFEAKTLSGTVDRVPNRMDDPPVCIPPPAGLIGWWTGDGSGVDIAGTNHATAQNGGGFTTAGQVAGAFNFVNPPNATSGQFAQITSPAGIPTGNSPRTVSLWFKTATNLSSATESALFNYGEQSAGHTFGLITSANAPGKLYFYGHAADLGGTTTILPDTWYFGSVTYDGTTVRLYLNGQLEANGDFALDTIMDPNGVTIGLRPASAVWNGQLDEIELYNRALSQTELQAIFNASSAGKCRACDQIPDGMLGWWDGENDAEDKQRFNHGSPVNGVTYDAGKIGNAFRFNAASQQYVGLPDQASQMISNSSGSISVWVNPTSVGEFDMITAFGSGGPGEAIGLGINTNVRVYHHTDALDWQTNTPVTPGVWTMLTYTWDQTTETIYKNGAFAESRPRGSFGYIPGFGRIAFGFINDPSVFFDGRIDELTVFDRALSAAEVGRIYNAGASGICETCSLSPNDPVSWWPGENNAEDAAGNNYGVLIGGAGFAPGIVGNAFSLNGTGANVRFPDSATLDVSTGFTIGAWVRPTQIPTYPQGAAVISKIGGVSNLNGYQMALTKIGGSYVVWCGFNTGGGVWPQHTVSGGNLTPGTWAYVSCTYDHETLAVQQNGQRVGSAVIGPVTVANTTSNLRIGSDDVAQQFYQGLIDEPMVFGRALTDEELGRLSENGRRGICRETVQSSCAAKPPGTVSWWRAENNVLDQRKQHHGTILSGTLFVPARSGRGFDFNAGAGGTEGVDLGTWFNLQTFSIEMWVRPKAGQVTFSNIIDNNHSSSPLRSWVMENLDNGNRFQWYSADFPAGSQLAFDLTPDLWHHIIVTRGADRVTRGYLNRSFVGSVSSSSDIPYDGSQNLRIGNWYAGNRPFNGTIDEVTIYDRALSENEINGLFNAAGFGKCAAGVTPADFDGDLATDISIFRPAGATGSEWWVLRSSTGGNWATQFGVPGDKIVAEDFTGDGKTDVAFYRPTDNFWYVLRSEDYSYYSFPFGTNGDIPAPADYDGDGIADAAVYRPSTGVWYIARSTGGLGQERFGFAEDRPVPADYDGDGLTDIAIFRPSNGQWWLNRTRDGLIVHTFGNAGDFTLPGDYTGDGKADIAIYRPSNGNWYILRSEDSSFYSFPFGTATDMPAAGDFDGDGVFDAAVFRESDGKWYLRRSTAGVTIIPFGASGDIPVAGAMVR